MPPPPRPTRRRTVSDAPVKEEPDNAETGQATSLPGQSTDHALDTVAHENSMACTNQCGFMCTWFANYCCKQCSMSSPPNFVHGKKIKKIFVSKAQLDALSAGRLVVVNNNGLYHFVNDKVARQIKERDPKRIIVAHGADDKPPEPGSDDEFYAKFEVPDDLDW